MPNCMTHLLQCALSDGYKAGPESLRLHAQATHHIANLHLLKLIAPFTLLVHVTANLADCPANGNRSDALQLL